MLLESLPVIGELLTKVIDIIDKHVSDKDLATKLKASLMEVTATQDHDLDIARSKVVTAEIQGKSWLQQSWRPMLMLTVVAIIFNNYVLFPYLRMFTDKAVILELPSELFTLLTVGVGGYIVGRSGEKIIQTWKN